MTRSRATRWLATGVGVVFIVLGVVEVAVRVLSSEPIDATAVAFWFVSLCGGGTLVLLGSFVIRRTGWALTAVVVGCLLGMNATMWTLVIPVGALALVVLSILQVARPALPADRSAHRDGAG